MQACMDIKNDKADLVDRTLAESEIRGNGTAVLRQFSERILGD